MIMMRSLGWDVIQYYCFPLKGGNVGSGRNQSDVIISKDEERMPGSHQELGQTTGTRSKMTHNFQKEWICRHLYF